MVKLIFMAGTNIPELVSAQFIAAEVTAIIEKPVMHRMEPRSGNLCQAEANKRMNAKQQTMSCLLLKDLFIHKYHY